MSVLSRKAHTASGVRQGSVERREVLQRDTRCHKASRQTTADLLQFSQVSELSRSDFTQHGSSFWMVGLTEVSRERRVALGASAGARLLVRARFAAEATAFKRSLSDRCQGAERRLGRTALRQP